MRRGEVDILDHQRFRCGIQVDDRDGLLGAICLLAELDAEPAIDHEEIAAFASPSKRVWAAKHRHGHGSDRRQMRGSIDYQRSGRRDGAALSSRFLLAQRDCAKPKSNH